jgi:hypothetical protein
MTALVASGIGLAQESHARGIEHRLDKWGPQLEKIVSLVRHNKWRELGVKKLVYSEYSQLYDDEIQKLYPKYVDDRVSREFHYFFSQREIDLNALTKSDIEKLHEFGDDVEQSQSTPIYHFEPISEPFREMPDLSVGIYGKIASNAYWKIVVDESPDGKRLEVRAIAYGEH